MEDEVMKLKGDKKIPLRILFKRTMVYVKPELLSFILAILNLFLNVGLDLYLPLVVENVIDHLSLSDDINLNYIILMSSLYLGISVLNMSFVYLESMLLQRQDKE